MQLNSIFTELQTVVKISKNIEGSSASADRQAHASQGAGTDEAVVVTKWVRLVGKLPLIDINPDSWETFKMDPHKKASIIAWLQDSPSSPDIPIENEEIIRVHRMILQYQNDNGIPQIEDTEFVSARSLLSKANNVSGQLTTLKQSLSKVSKILKELKSQ